MPPTTSQLAALHHILRKEPAVRGELEVMLVVSMVASEYRFFQQLDPQTLRKVCRYMGLREAEKRRTRGGELLRRTSSRTSPAPSPAK